jgi:hypothetical protein
MKIYIAGAEPNDLKDELLDLRSALLSLLGKGQKNENLPRDMVI